MGGFFLMKNKVAIITGASSGIGRATAFRLASEGVRVCLMDLKESKAETVKKEIHENGGEAIVTVVDVSDPERVKSGVEQVMSRWGQIDIVFANAGINGTVAPIEDLTPEDWDHTFSANLKSTFLLVKYVIPHMKHRGGSIIVTSSINGSRTFSNIGMSDYSASKAGQVAFAKMAALELARYKIRVNVICPGAVQTNIGKNTKRLDQLDKVEIPVIYPQSRFPLEHAPGEPEQVANLVHFLSSDAASHISGTEIYIDGAESLL